MEQYGGRPVDLIRSRLVARERRVIADRGHDFKAQCPVPDHGRGRGDLNPSLKVATGDDDDRALLHCHAGCTIEQVLVALGLAWPDLHPPGVGFVPFDPQSYSADPSNRARTGARGGSGGSGSGGEDETGKGSARSKVPQTPRDGDLPRAGALQRDERRWAIEAYRDGSLPVEPVWSDAWPELPTDTLPVRRLVADHCRLVRALLLAMGDDRPFALPSDEVAEDLRIAKLPAHRAMVWLASDEVGFLANVGQLPSRPGRRGAFLYLPGRGPASGTAADSVAIAAALPAEAGGVEADDAARVDERQEVGDDVAVLDAVTADGREVLELDGRLGAPSADAGGGAGSHVAHLRVTVGGARCAIFDDD